MLLAPNIVCKCLCKKKMESGLNPSLISFKNLEAAAIRKKNRKFKIWKNLRSDAHHCLLQSSFSNSPNWSVVADFVEVK